jgi:uncharacterized protein YcfJ
LKKLLLAATVLSFSCGAFAQADHAPAYGARAKRKATLCDTCGTVQETKLEKRKGEGGAVGIVGGAVAGGLLGNQVGKGHGREAATAAGAVIGAIAGDRIANSQPQAYVNQPREVRSCRTVNDVQQRLTGYRVTYEYHGQEYTTVTRDQPGRTLPVRVSVTPLEER